MSERQPLSPEEHLYHDANLMFQLHGEDAGLRIVSEGIEFSPTTVILAGKSKRSQHVVSLAQRMRGDAFEVAMNISHASLREVRSYTIAEHHSTMLRVPLDPEQDFDTEPQRISDENAKALRKVLWDVVWNKADAEAEAQLIADSIGKAAATRFIADIEQFLSGHGNN